MIAVAQIYYGALHVWTARSDEYQLITPPEAINSLHVFQHEDGHFNQLMPLGPQHCAIASDSTSVGSLADILTAPQPLQNVQAMLCDIPEPYKSLALEGAQP